MSRTFAFTLLIIGSFAIGTTRAQVFTDVADEVGLNQSGTPGATNWYDYDDDGDLDLLRAHRFNGAVHIYRHDGEEFTQLTGLGLPTSADVQNAQPIDFDRDGDIDVFFVGYHEDFQLYVNQGGTFVDQTVQMGLDPRSHTREFSWVDFNHDGFLDILIAFQDEWRVYHSIHGQMFFDATDISGLPNTSDITSFALCDYNLDGEMDIFATRHHASNFLYKNIGNGEFVNESAASNLGQTESNSGCVWADFNNDKFPDLLTPGYDFHSIWLNNQDGTFTEMNVQGTTTDFESGPYPRGGRYAVADYDMDGDLDFFVSRPGGTGVYEAENQFFRQEFQDGLDIGFINLAPQYGMDDIEDGFPRWCDYDADGDMDLLLPLNGLPARLYRNNSAPAGHLEVRVMSANGSEDRWHRRVDIFEHGTQNFVRQSELSNAATSCNGLNNYFVLNDNQPYDIYVYLTDGGVLTPANRPELSGVIPSQVDHLVEVYAYHSNCIPPTAVTVLAASANSIQLQAVASQPGEHKWYFASNANTAAYPDAAWTFAGASIAAFEGEMMTYNTAIAGNFRRYVCVAVCEDD